jgi:hypothetical protein
MRVTKILWLTFGARPVSFSVYLFGLSLNSTISQFKVVLQDIIRIFSGACALISYCFSKDNIPVALSQFSTESFFVIPGNTYSYDLHICNDTGTNAAVKLLVDIYAKELPVHPEGHYAYYSKNIYLTAHESKHLVVSYNWIDSFAIRIDELSHMPDDSWRGTCRQKGAYLIQAILLNEHGQRLDGLSIVQQLV